MSRETSGLLVLVAIVVFTALAAAGVPREEPAGASRLAATPYDRYGVTVSGYFYRASALILDSAADPEAIMDQLFPGSLRPGEVGAAFTTFTLRAEEDLPAPVVYNATGAPAGVDTIGAIQFAIATWNGALGHTFRFHYEGTSAAAAPNGCDDDTEPDGVNVVAWGELDEDVLGSTCTLSFVQRDRPADKRAQESDVTLNPAMPWSTASQTALSDVDLFSVVLHELGHFLGLDHSDDRDAVMYERIRGGAQRRALTPDDLAGLRSLYGDGSSPPANDPRTHIRFLGALARDR